MCGPVSAGSRSAAMRIMRRMTLSVSCARSSTSVAIDAKCSVNRSSSAVKAPPARPGIASGFRSWSTPSTTSAALRRGRASTAPVR